MLDSTVVVAAERQGKNAHQMLEDVSVHTGDTEIALSVVTLLELMHGVVRANTPERKARRQGFIDELLTAMPVQPVTIPIALRAGQIDAKTQAAGIRIPLSDLLIGVSALELGHSIATSNVRHFQKIPNLTVPQI